MASPRAPSPSRTPAVAHTEAYTAKIATAESGSPLYCRTRVNTSFQSILNKKGQNKHFEKLHLAKFDQVKFHTFTRTKEHRLRNACRFSLSPSNFKHLTFNGSEKNTHLHQSKPQGDGSIFDPAWLRVSAVVKYGSGPAGVSVFSGRKTRKRQVVT